MLVRWTLRALESLAESTEYIRCQNPTKANQVITEIKKLLITCNIFLILVFLLLFQIHGI
jgi:hypothetical protein